jgi:hypothetical protein
MYTVSSHSGTLALPRCESHTSPNLPVAGACEPTGDPSATPFANFTFPFLACPISFLFKLFRAILHSHKKQPIPHSSPHDLTGHPSVPLRGHNLGATMGKVPPSTHGPRETYRHEPVSKTKERTLVLVAGVLVTEKRLGFGNRVADHGFADRNTVDGDCSSLFLVEGDSVEVASRAWIVVLG